MRPGEDKDFKMRKEATDVSTNQGTDDIFSHTNPHVKPCLCIISLYNNPTNRER